MTHEQSEPVRVGINLMWLRPGEVGGSERYIVSILEAIAASHAGGTEVTLYALPGFSDAYPGLASAFGTVTAPVSGASRLLRVVVENLWLARRASADRLDVLHHAGGTMPRRSGPNPVLTLHDLQYLDHPEFFGAVKRAWLGFVVPRSARRAAAVITASSHTRSRVIEATRCDPGRVHSVYHAIPAPPRDHGGRGGAASPSARPYVYYPAWTHPHKNHAVLLAALRRVPDVDLVLTGGAGLADDEVTRRIGELDLTERVHRLGHVPAPAVEDLYAGATALVFPSRYEGFGAPVAEAMVRGVPVISSNATCLPEVVGEGGLLVDPDDVDGWVEALHSVRSADVRRGLIERGAARAAAFTPATTVSRLVAVWSDVGAARP